MINKYYPKVQEIQRQLKEHSAAQNSRKPDGSRRYTHVAEGVKDMERPYHPNIGFYTPLKPPARGLNDPRCTKSGRLGCRNRCFNPLNTRCLNWKVIGPEASIDSSLSWEVSLETLLVLQCKF